MSHNRIDYYFWPSSDWSYLGHDRLLTLARQTGVSINFKPVRSKDLLAQTGGQPLLKRSQARQSYRLMELARWKKVLASDIVIEPDFFPVDNEAALRLLVNATKAGVEIGDLARAVMRKLWSENRNIADHETLIEAAQSADISENEARGWIDDKTGNVEIDRNTADAVSAGAFGAPTYIFDGEVFWGQDRIEHLAQRISEQIGIPRKQLTF